MHTAFIYARARAEHARRIAIAGLVAVATVTPAAAANWSDKYGDPRSAISSPDYPNAGTPRGDAALAAAARSSGWSSTQSNRYTPNPLSRRSPYGAYGIGSPRPEHGVGSNSSDPNNCRSRCN